jgi:hypothetical protein
MIYAPTLKIVWKNGLRRAAKKTPLNEVYIHWTCSIASLAKCIAFCGFMRNLVRKLEGFAPTLLKINLYKEIFHEKDTAKNH